MPREGIGRFAGKNEFSDVEFLEIFKELLPYVQSGEIDLDSVKSVDMVEKMDSSFIHFGINPAGKFFMESSNSGEVTADDYQQRFSHTFMADYKAAFASLLENKLLQTTLQKIFKKVGAIRYDAELFPVLTHTGDESGYITFVATRYDKAKFGTKGAFVVFKSWIKDENAQWTRPEPKKNIALIGAIEAADSAEWRIYTNEKHAKLSGVVQLKALNVDKMLSTPEAIDEAIEVLSARGNTTIKAHLKNVIGDLKEKLQGVLDKYAEETSSIFSKPDSPSSIEGVVLRIKKANGDIFEVKGTSNAFDTLKKQTWATRSSLSELEATVEGSFLKDALGLKTAQAAALNRHIKDFAATFSSKEKNPEKREHEFLLKLFDAMQNKDAMVSPEETKKRVNQIFEVAKNQLAVIIDEFKSQKIDPDSKRKSLEALKTIIDKFDTIEKTVNTDMPDEAFQLYIFKFMLDRRLKQYAGQHMNAAEQDFSKFYEGVTPVIIWNGRAQPWHRGHDAMIQLAKKKLEELGAEKILILIVKGGKSSMNKDENPLTEKDQKALVEAVYAGDASVVVSDTPLANGSLFAIIQKLGEMKAYMVGWLAGEDRIGDYEKLLKSFNASVWLKDHASLPIKVNSKGVADVQMIQTPRVMSGTAARESAKTMDFKGWLANVAPAHSQKNKAAVGIYKQIYELLNSMKAESVLRDLVWKKFNESVVLNELHPDAPDMANKMMDRMEKHIQEYNDAPEDKKKDALERIKKSIGPIESGVNSPEFEKLPDDIKNRAKQILQKVKEIESPASANVGDKISGPDGKEQTPLLPSNKETEAPQEKPQESPKSDSKKVFKEFIRSVPRYASSADPERLKKFLSGSLGALTGAVVWMMKAENEKGGSAAEVFTSGVSSKWKQISDKIKNKQAAADEINKLIKSASADMQELIQSLLETQAKAKQAFDSWSEQNRVQKSFDEYANPRRMSAAKHDSSNIEKSMDEIKYKYLINHVAMLASIQGFDNTIKQGLQQIIKSKKGNTEFKKSYQDVVDALGKMDIPYDIIKPIIDENLGDVQTIKKKIEDAIQESKNKKASTSQPNQQSPSNKP